MPTKFAIIGLGIVLPSAHMVARIGVSFAKSMTFASRDRTAMRVVLTLGQLGVSPGFRLRPSLSGPRHAHLPVLGRGVSPGFRLRPSLSAEARDARGGHRRRVSPGFRLRPSLSVALDDRVDILDRAVSPGFRLRPSLSASCRVSPFGFGGMVSPGFRLRPSLSEGIREPVLAQPTAVSPGFRLRPSLNGLLHGLERRQAGACRRGSDSGLR